MTQSVNTPPDCLPEGAIPGEILPAQGEIILNDGQPTVRLMVINRGDRPVQVGSHYHFAEVNPALDLDRAQAWGKRLNIPSGGAVRFEPGQEREVTLIAYRGKQRIRGFHGEGHEK